MKKRMSAHAREMEAARVAYEREQDKIVREKEKASKEIFHYGVAKVTK